MQVHRPAHGRLCHGLCTATATRDPRAETQDSSPSRLDGGRLRRAVLEPWRAKPQVRSGGAGVVAVLVALFSP
jgi:hypothetical protein